MATSNPISEIELRFPLLKKIGYTVTSPCTQSYNCIAWAVGDNSRWWWPDANLIYYWPKSVPRSSDLRCFTLMLNTFGYSVCYSKSVENNFQKIALYGHGTNVTHASRQLPNGKWTSKLGSNHDIEHTYEGLDMGDYGGIIAIFKKRISSLN